MVKQRNIDLQALPFLQALCWQLTDPEALSSREILQTYERGWRYLGTLAVPNDSEWQLIRNLSNSLGSWLQTNIELGQPQPMKYQWHESILTILSSLRAEVLDAWGVYFGGGTQVSLSCGEHRLSQDIDLITNLGGYRQVRSNIQERGYDALFENYDRLRFPREIQADQYGVRFPIAVDNITVKLEIVCEGRIELAPPVFLDWSLVPCLSPIDCWAEKLLANSDRWNDQRVRSRDLIDLAVLRLGAGPPMGALAKAEAAYPVLPALTSAIAQFQADADWRYQCYESLAIDQSALIIDGIDLLAGDFGRSATIRTANETH
jgi:hypothetical protein